MSNSIVIILGSKVRFMKELAERADLSHVLQKLSSIAVQLLDTGCMRYM